MKHYLIASILALVTTSVSADNPPPPFKSTTTVMDSILFNTDTAAYSSDSAVSKEELRSLIREVVREVVQEELAKLQPNETKTPTNNATPAQAEVKPKPTAIAPAKPTPASVAQVSSKPATFHQGEGLAHTCAGCHGTLGRIHNAAFMPLAGMQQEEFVGAMLAFRDDKRPSTLMGTVAKGLSEDQIKAMGEYFAQLPLEANP